MIPDLDRGYFLSDLTIIVNYAVKTIRIIPSIFPSQETHWKILENRIWNGEHVFKLEWIGLYMTINIKFNRFEISNQFSFCFSLRDTFILTLFLSDHKTITSSSVAICRRKKSFLEKVLLPNYLQFFSSTSSVTKTFSLFWYHYQ